MDRSSILNGTALADQCDLLIASLNEENERLTRKMQATSKFIKSDLDGRAIKSMKRFSVDFISATGLMIEANERDIYDLHTLKSRVDGVNIDGNKIISEMEEAKRNYNSCRDSADEYSSKAGSAKDEAERSKYVSEAKSYSDKADHWNSVYNSLVKEADLYDQLSYETDGLFQDGNCLRKYAYSEVDRLIGVNTNGGKNITIRTISKPRITPVLYAGEIPPEFEDRLREVAEEYGLTDDEIDYILENYPGLLVLLYLCDRFPFLSVQWPLGLVQDCLGQYQGQDQGQQDLVVDGYTVSSEYLQILKDLEMPEYYLTDYGYGYYENGELVGIYPHYVGDGGITFGYGHYVSRNEYNTDPDEQALVDTYCPSGAMNSTNAYGVVPDSDYVPMDEVNSMFAADVSEHVGPVVNWLNENNVNLTDSQIFALIMYRYNHGNIGALLPSLEDYRDGLISNSEFNELWDGPANRQEAYRDLWGD
ncbi:MAG: hypothetical protein J6U54_12105 [Clostridiales bacterium]|nr:hypothetical protein [Clostridiales bacterium]